MKKLYFLLVLILVFLITGCGKDKVDIRDTGFKYNIEVCDKYFKLVECIINKDTNQNYTKQMRIELKNEVKDMQEEWKQLSEQELMKKCTEGLSQFETNEMKENLKSFGCLEK